MVKVVTVTVTASDSDSNSNSSDSKGCVCGWSRVVRRAVTGTSSCDGHL